MIGELWSLKDKLNAVIKVANLPNYLSTNLQSDQTPNNGTTTNDSRNSNLDDVFLDFPDNINNIYRLICQEGGRGF